MALQISNQFLEYVQEKDIDIDDTFIQIFYNSISMDTWIDYERAQQYLQYERRDNFIKQLKKYFIEGEDFREIQNDQIPENLLLPPGGVRQHGGHLKKYYLISPDTFKSLLLLRNNEIRKRYRQYMITLEKLFKEFILFIHEKQEKRLVIKDKKILKAKDEQQKLIILSQEDRQLIDELQNQLVIQKIEHEEELLNREKIYSVISIHKIDEDYNDEEDLDIKRPQLVCITTNPQQIFKTYTTLLDKYYKEEMIYHPITLADGLTKKEAINFKNQHMRNVLQYERAQHKSTQCVTPLFE